MSVRIGRATALGSAVLLAGVGLVLAAAPAHAHDSLVSTSPRDGASVRAVPAVVELTFNKPVLGIGSAVRVTGPSGEVAAGKASVVDETVRQPLTPGAPAGTYTVSWRVTSADGHPISDSSTFTARAASAAASSATASASAATVPAADDSEDEANWTQIIIGGALGAAVGTAYILIRRRRARSS